LQAIRDKPAVAGVAKLPGMIGAIRSASSNRRMYKTMNTGDKTSGRGAIRWTLLPAIAVTAMLAGLPAAKAQDFNPQDTAAQRDDAINWSAAVGQHGAYARAPHEFAGRPRGAYAQAPYEFRSHSYRRHGY
jgi:hypothetical protein